MGRLLRLAVYDVNGESVGPEDLVGYVDVPLQALAEVAMPYTEMPQSSPPWHLRFGLRHPSPAMQNAFLSKVSCVALYVQQRRRGFVPTADVLGLLS